MEVEMKIMNIFENLKQIAMIFTLIYIWVASCIFLVENVNVISANACFYGGVSFIILSLITSPRVKK